jgi:hypothetical protein
MLVSERWSLNYIDFIRLYSSVCEMCDLSAGMCWMPV